MQEPAWLEVSLTFEPDQSEVAEAVAQVLARLSEGRVVWSYEHPQAAAPNHIRHWAPVTVRAYLPITPKDREDVRRRVEEALWHLHVIRPLPAARFRVLRDEDWLHAWKRFYRPIPVGRRLLVVPAWMEPPEGDRTVIFIEPGTAFGTGMHPSTRLCLEALEERVRPGEPLMDIGCGSGILAIAAAKLGARPVLAVDIEPQALEETRDNARRNRVEDRIHVHQGSVAEILAGETPLGKAPVVVANIFAEVLAELLDQGLARLVTSPGYLVLSGILEEREDLVRRAAARQGLTLVDRAQEGEWVCLQYRR